MRVRGIFIWSEMIQPHGRPKFKKHEKLFSVNQGATKKKRIEFGPKFWRDQTNFFSENMKKLMNLDAIFGAWQALMCYVAV